MKIVSVIATILLLWLLLWGALAGAQATPQATTPAVPTPVFAAGNPAPAAAAVPEGMTVAVFDFASRDKSLEDSATLLSELVRTQLTMQGKLRLVTREELNKVLEEQKLSLAGVTDDAAPKIGKLLGAQVLVLGRLFKINGENWASAKVVGVETSRVYAEMVHATPDKLEMMGMELGQKVSGLIEKGADTLVAKVRLTGPQLATLKKVLAGKPLPRVFVYVREQPLPVPIPDPAAQTEIGFILKKIGCDVVTDKSGQLDAWADAFLNGGNKTAPPPLSSVDMILIGEGISQYASRTGDLVSSRARVELEAIDPPTGKVLAIDRETFVGVDLSEQISSKTALQESAARLALRLIPEAITAWRATPSAATASTTATLGKK